jgi:hypothetical protein
MRESRHHKPGSPTAIVPRRRALTFYRMWTSEWQIAKVTRYLGNALF